MSRRVRDLNLPLIGTEERPEGLVGDGTTSSGGDKSENDENEAPFVLSEGLPVRKIQKGGFVDMVELLRDNMEVYRQEEGTPKPSRRAVPDLLSWVICFGAYASIVYFSKNSIHSSTVLQKKSRNNRNRSQWWYCL